MSVGEIATRLGVNLDMIYQWSGIGGKMPANKLGRPGQFMASEVDPWVKGGHATEDVAPAAPRTPDGKDPFTEPSPMPPATLPSPS